jgi:peptidoglycan/LPS O-acetylase OafA/YrhL
MSVIKIQTPPTTERVPDLDGLRGLAILMVIVCHYVFLPRFGRGSMITVGISIFASGVTLFFVLSGFLIGGILLDNRLSLRYFTAFYGRRISRIFPVYYSFLIAMLCGGLALHAHHLPTPVFDAGTPFVLFWIYLQNFGLAWFKDWNWITVTMTWSLALEEQFYLTLPVAVKALRDRSLVILSGMLVILAPIARYFFPYTPYKINALIDQACNADALAAGVLCAVFVRSTLRVPSRQISLFAAASALLIVLSYSFDWPVLRPTLLLFFYSCGLLLAVQGRMAPLRWPGMRFFGTISYTLYMIHQSVLVAVRWAFGRFVPEFGRHFVFVSLVALLLSVAICKASWDYFERPILSWARRRFRY